MGSERALRYRGGDAAGRASSWLEQISISSLCRPPDASRRSRLLREGAGGLPRPVVMMCRRRKTDRLFCGRTGLGAFDFFANRSIRSGLFVI